MVPAGDLLTQQDIDASFSMANMIPQKKILTNIHVKKLNQMSAKMQADPKAVFISLQVPYLNRDM
jgi:DNA/RNA endonuclease G (NUC1)